MKTLRVYPLSLGVFLAAVIGSPLCGQGTTTPAVPGSDTRKPINPAESRATFNNARTLAKANNVDAAEQTLVALNRAKPGTAAWHSESANRLIQLSGELSRSASITTAKSLTAKAQEHLNQALRLARTPQERSRAHAALGYLHERYNGNVNAAIASYQAAVEAMPKNASALEALQRLQQSVKNEQSRTQTATRR